MRVIVSVLIILLLFCCESKLEDKTVNFSTHYELSEGMETATYLQVIDFYIQLAKEFPEINIQIIGDTDSGYPLHVATYTSDGTSTFKKSESYEPAHMQYPVYRVLKK